MAAVLLEDPQDFTKGKGKAELRQATETTPLLQAESHEGSIGDEDEQDPQNSLVARRRLWKRLSFVFIFTLLICFIIFLFLALLAYSYTTRLSYVSPHDILATALVFKGPDQVDVINATDGGLWVRLDARVGVDAGSIIGVNTNPGATGNLWKSLGRLGIRVLGTVTANVAAVHVSSDRGALLANIFAQPVQLPITSNPPHDSSWLTHISIPVFVRPTDNASDLAQFVEDSWRHGRVSVQASIPDVTIWGGSPKRKGWRSMLNADFSNVKTQASLPSGSFYTLFIFNLNTSFASPSHSWFTRARRGYPLTIILSACFSRIIRHLINGQSSPAERSCRCHRPCTTRFRDDRPNVAFCRVTPNQ